MTRNALRRYLYGLVVASLPACCHDTGPEWQPYSVDAALFAGFDGGVERGAALPPELCRKICHAAEPCSAGPVEDGGTAQVVCEGPGGQKCSFPLAAGGRPPPGLRPVAIFCEDPVAAWFAYLAHVEGAAVYGFLQLADELQRLGAPATLVDAAHQAAEDERRHARIALRLARAAVPAVEIDVTPPRSAFQIALDNAVEGGVFETFGVAVTLWQSRQAADRRVRAAFCRIYEDELRHAELAQSVARWLEPRLTPEQRGEIARARRAAAARLARMVAQPRDEALLRVAGLPPPAVAGHWVAQMTDALWS
jgi:hypothetical protein